VDSTGPVVHVVILMPGEPPPPGAAAMDATRPSRDTVDALSQLGGEVELSVVRDAVACLDAVRAGGVDLVLLDRAEAREIERVLDALRASSVPVVVVTDEPGEAVALESFRNGAADCVRVGPDYADVLPVVVLEQLRRSRAQRERGVAERRIRELKHYNENLIQNLNSALLVIDPDGRVVTGNVMAEKILAAPPGSLAGRMVWDWLAAKPREHSVIGRTLSDGVRWNGAETVMRRDDGEEVPIGISCSPLAMESEASLLEPGPARHGAVAIFQDLSEIKLMQRQLLQSEKMASIGQLAAGVAHEINNPMGFIHANLFQMTEYLGDLRQAWECVDELQKAVHGGELDAIRKASDALATTVRELDLDFVQTDFAKAVRESQEGAERIRHIVRDLRDFSHRDTETCVEADVNQCVDSTVNIAFTMMKHSVVLEKSYCEVPEIRCYPMQLKQVFMNLLVNAYQAIEEKFGDSGELGEIHVATECRGDQLVVTVRDSGAGIAPGDLNRIFDPFFTTKAVGAGTGLGLATSYNIVGRHDGKILVESTLGEGTTFEVWLPLEGPKVELGRSTTPSHGGASRP